MDKEWISYGSVLAFRNFSEEKSTGEFGIIEKTQINTTSALCRVAH
ncbi:hypothetical protein [Candidatus Azobacteroides pseudotrichonymphae]|nr:hypothetical protein [Candidatus Azobacteroides pseudotrichonymphae]